MTTKLQTRHVHARVVSHGGLHVLYKQTNSNSVIVKSLRPEDCQPYLKLNLRTIQGVLYLTCKFQKLEIIEKALIYEHLEICVYIAIAIFTSSRIIK